MSTEAQVFFFLVVLRGQNFRRELRWRWWWYGEAALFLCPGGWLAGTNGGAEGTHIWHKFNHPLQMYVIVSNG